ncbi:MAG: hypothetical protein EZS28_023946 [Streblomastix strix]|uniref:Uncharacterized protein n=1 Tax=Streblomastix strix TaxID=222440 RepID=A0A5J4VDF6_9EUKA|nr:MAG: hypothetical protein EZS28_023946 [Streblomastix strix]
MRVRAPTILEPQWYLNKEVRQGDTGITNHNLLYETNPILIKQELKIRPLEFFRIRLLEVSTRCPCSFSLLGRHLIFFEGLVDIYGSWFKASSNGIYPECYFPTRNQWLGSVTKSVWFNFEFDLVYV